MLTMRRSPLILIEKRRERWEGWTHVLDRMLVINLNMLTYIKTNHLREREV